MSLYARDTEVSSDQSAIQIKRTIRRYKGDNIVIGESEEDRRAYVQFTFRKLLVRMELTLPDAKDPAFQMTATGRRRRNGNSASAAYEKACRQQWRVLGLLVQANLEAVENDVMPAEQVFLPWLLTAAGVTVGAIFEGHAQQFMEMKELKELPRLLLPAPKDEVRR